MTPKITIYVEGNDKYFLEAFIRARFSEFPIEKENIIEFADTDGKDNLKSYINLIRERTEDNDGIVLIIFDADENENVVIENLKEREKLKISVFLFPDNKNKGNFETLLKQIIPTENKKFFDCFANYVECLKHLENTHNLPDKDNEMGTYGWVFLPKNKSKNNYEYYTHQAAWNLKHTALEPLYLFLKEHLETIK